jgi:hypothetical protein
VLEYEGRNDERRKLCVERRGVLFFPDTDRNPDLLKGGKQKKTSSKLMKMEADEFVRRYAREDSTQRQIVQKARLDGMAERVATEKFHLAKEDGLLVPVTLAKPGRAAVWSSREDAVAAVSDLDRCKAYLAENPDASAEDVAAAVGCSVSTVRMAI